MAGILSAIKLPEVGITDFTVYEKADRVGGTWRENIYPGLSCDVPSHLYSFSFEQSAEWSHRFAPGVEIQKYFEDVAERHGILDRVRFGDAVTRCEYSEGKWQITTASGHTDEVDVVIAATGVLHHPKYPDIEGLDNFEGAMFHSAAWDRQAKLDAAKVGMIGTGSTAVQITSAIVEEVGHLSLFQRTAQWVMSAENPSFSQEEIESFRARPDSLTELRQQQADFFDIFATAVVDSDSDEMKLLEQFCVANLESKVTDPDLRERLRPDYRPACKRLVISPNFYEAIQHPNVELVTEGIDHVESAGVVTKDGRLHELDVLVLATGFHVDAFMRPMDIIGRNGVTLEDAWSPRPVAYLSISIPEFPNLFMINGPNGPVGNFSLIEVAELQVGYLLQLIDHIRSGTATEVCATYDALAEFEVAREEASRQTVWVTGCRSWYLDDRGVPSVWPWSFARFREVMKAPDLASYDFR
jgi:cation diffusion facilitator CzcD-associated flavoprotein CzcO